MSPHAVIARANSVDAPGVLRTLRLSFARLNARWGWLATESQKSAARSSGASFGGIGFGFDREGKLLSCFQRFFTNEAETAREGPQCLLFQRLHVSDAGRGRHEDALR
jgi:hypothetical protein